MVLTVMEIASKIKEEGKFSGYPATHIKLSGCNLSCSYCKYLGVKVRRKRMNISNILNTLFKMGNNKIVISGGEPLIQDSVHILIYDLVSRHYDVVIYTNGSQLIDEEFYDRSFSYCMEFKCPSSRMAKHNNYLNLERLKAKDEVKFRIKNEKDFVFAKELLKKYPTRANVIMSPVITEGNQICKDLVDWIIMSKLPRTQLGLPINELMGLNEGG